MITVADVRTALPAEAEHTDETLAAVLAAEHSAQRSVCTIPSPRPQGLDDALVRRVLVNLDQTGGDPVTRVGGGDPDVRALEAPHSLRVSLAVKNGDEPKPVARRRPTKRVAKKSTTKQKG